MSDKEMNLAILNKLYEIAFAVWEKMAKVADYGSYTASEIANMLNKEFNFSNEQNEDEKTTVSVGTYTCSFPLKNIFYFVSVFEKLASVGIDELLEDLFNDGHYSWNKDNTEKVGFVGNEPILVRQENDNKLLVRFLGDAWCPDVVEEWVKRIEHDKNNDVDYVIDTYMFGVIENDRERKSSDFHVSFYYRG